MINRVHIFGASGSGTTTLAKHYPQKRDICTWIPMIIIVPYQSKSLQRLKTLQAFFIANQIIFYSNTWIIR
jgi:hypothetical protein